MTADVFYVLRAIGGRAALAALRVEPDPPPADPWLWTSVTTEVPTLDCPFCCETPPFCRCNYAAEYAALALESPVAFASPVVHFGGGR